MLRKLTFIVCFLIAVFIIYPDSSFAAIKNVHNEKAIETIDKGKSLLYTIDEYQEKYFTIIKRNNVLLRYEGNTELKKDRKELRKLYK